MKKLFLTLIVSLALCGSVFAQGYETYWPGFNGNFYEDQDGLVAAIIIDGEPITVDYEGWNALEVAAFITKTDGTEECRAVGIYLNDEFVLEFGDPYPVTWGDAIFYTNPGEELHFKMYDHSRNIEYIFVTALQYDEPLTLLTGDAHFEGWDNPDDVISLSFVSPEPETHYWANPDTWEGGSVPGENADVTLTTDVIIGAGTVVHAGNVDLNGHTLTMEPGAEFYHTNAVEMTIQMEVEGYEGAKDEDPENDGYRLIASPIDSSIDVPAGLLEGDFDLYYFDQAGEGDETYEYLEWRNYKADAFPLELGKGYLYANSEDVFAVFVGNTISTDAEVPVELEDVEGARLHGLNLVGNPFTCTAYVDMPYYVLNENGDEMDVNAVTSATPIAPMKGFFVQRTDEATSCNFTVTAPSKRGALNMTVSQGRGVVDNAIVAFDQGHNLGKFQLNPNHTKVFMTQDGKDYAVLQAEAQGEMPVSFKAESNGTYTMGFTTEGVSFNYLHLIDNMTGADVDLLATPSYTFNALTTDYASRFRLVFATGNAAEDSFAFMSNGNLIVSNDGEATLQVVDVNGRILTSESINGSASVSVNAAAGVYVLRLVNGNDVKVQKIVIR